MTVEQPIEAEPKIVEAPRQRFQRLTSLDAFRGATVALMLVVNNIALDEATPAQLMHAPFGEWARLADLVFPWFLLCAGLSMPLSFRSAERKGVAFGAWMRKAFSRMVGLLLLGMFLDSAVNRQITLGLGVLQLIGLAGFVAALVIRLKPLIRWTIAAALLAGYGAALAWIPVPTEGRPVISEHANLVLYLNTNVFQPLGLRGLPSVVPTAALVIMGTLIGEALAYGGRKKALIAGLVATALGAAWSLGHPMAKEIWTAPYILFSGGVGTLIVVALAWILDGRPWAKIVAPLLVFGANPLIAYAGPILVKTLILQVWWATPGRTLQEAWLEGVKTRFGAVTGGWIYTLGYIALTWVVLAWMRKRGVVVRM